MRSYAILVLGLLAGGCATTGEKVVSIQPVQPAEAKPPAEALVSCVKPGKLEDQSFGAVVRKLSEALGLLDECASKHEQLKRFELDKEKPSGKL